MKKGFTLIEIIISIGLISVIGISSIVSFNFIKNKNKISVLNSMSDEILTALRVYIETNDDLKYSVYEDKEGLVVTLKTLENNGLIDFDDINVENDYVVALLSQESDCTDITKIDSWDLTDGTLNICLKGSSNNQSVKNNLISNGSYIARGTNPNNWVYFPVISKTSDKVYFPNDDEQNLWRIVSINEEGQIKLAYNKTVKVNVAKKYSYLEFTSNTYTWDNKLYTQRKGYPDEYYLLSSSDNWMGSEIVVDTGNKELLYNNIVNKDMIKESSYACTYRYDPSSGFNLLSFSVCSLKLGTVSIREVEDSYLQDGTFLAMNIAFGKNNKGSYYTMLYNGYTDVNDDTWYIANTDGKKFYTFTGGPYLPAVILNSDVELVKDTSCSEKSGSKNCPYKLECKNC